MDTSNIENIVKESFSYRDVAKKIGIIVSTGHYINKVKRVIGHLDTSHFTGKSHRKLLNSYRVDIEDYLLLNGKTITSYNLKNNLFSRGLKECKCESCGLEEWMGNKMPLELHHMNGKKNDNRLENLQILCPNCHALSTNYRGGNTKKRKKSQITEEEFIAAISNSFSVREALKKLGICPYGGNYDRANRIIAQGKASLLK